MKFETAIALREAIKKAGLPCHAEIDGATVRISDNTAFEPDALVYCGEKPPRGSLEIPNPTVVVEVLSPGTAMRDAQSKLRGYLSLPSVHHYLILNPETRMVTHHARAGADEIRTRILSSGPLRLDPPGLDMQVRSLFRQCNAKRRRRSGSYEVLTYRSISPNTMSRLPSTAETSASICPLHRKSMAARCGKPGARILRR